MLEQYVLLLIDKHRSTSVNSTMMKGGQWLLKLFLCLLLCLVVTTSTVNRRRVKRRLDEFAKMIELTCDRSALDFNGYGNYCGLGGGGDPIDDIDTCCKIHDSCYSRVNRKECATLLKYKVYTTDYRWQSNTGEITCKDTRECPEAICNCDRAAAICFGTYNHLYNTENKHSGIVKGLSKLLHIAS